MTDYKPFLSVNERDGLYNQTGQGADTLNRSLHSDKEIMPDDLSSDQGEGHGHSKEGPKASMIACALNITNTIIGAGILGLPNVLSQFGIILGCGIIFISYVLTYISSSFLLKAKNLCQHSKYITIGKHCLGNPGLWAVKMIIIINNFGLCIAYLIIFSTVASNLLTGFDSDCQLVDDEGPDNRPVFCRQWLLTLCAAILVCPLIFAKSLAKLWFASAVAVFAAGTFSVLTVANFFHKVSKDGITEPINILPHIANPVAALSSVTSVFLAFTFQFNFFPIYKTLENPTDQRMRKTTFSGLTLVLFIYFGVAICGYLTFGSKNSTAFLKNYSRDELGTAVFVIVNIAFLFSSTLTLPLMFFGAKNEIYGAIKLIRRYFATRNNVVDTDSPLREEREGDDENALDSKYGFHGAKFTLYIIILFGIIVFFAVLVPKIDTVFNFVGSTAANALNFILPSIFYLKLSKRSKWRPVAMGMMIFGIIMCFVGVISASINLANK